MSTGSEFISMICKKNPPCSGATDFIRNIVNIAFILDEIEKNEKNIDRVCSNIFEGLKMIQSKYGPTGNEDIEVIVSSIYTLTVNYTDLEEFKTKFLQLVERVYPIPYSESFDQNTSFPDDMKDLDGELLGEYTNSFDPNTSFSDDMKDLDGELLGEYTNSFDPNTSFSDDMKELECILLGDD